MHIYIYVKGALTKMVKALIPRSSKAKSVLVSQKYDRKISVRKKRKPTYGKSLLCTVKYYQSEGVTENEEKIKETG